MHSNAQSLTSEQRTTVNNGLLADVAPNAGKALGAAGASKALNAGLFDDIDAELEDNFSTNKPINRVS